jgi:hypothetical protein
MVGYLEQAAERRNGPGGDYIESAGDLLNLRALDGRVERERLHGLAQELGAKAARLYQDDRTVDEARND